MIIFNVVTIFPDQIKAFTKEGIYRIAKQKEKTKIEIHDLRKWGEGKHRKVDDRPFGGGPGMVLMIEPIYKAIKQIKSKYPNYTNKVILTTPKGEKLNQKKLKKLTLPTKDINYIIICGHYEGFDQRVHDHLTDIEISIGDFVISGGELPALLLMDGIIRLIPGVLGNKESFKKDSFYKSKKILDYPQYTRPAEFKDWRVPKILLSGHHKNITKWRNNKQNNQENAL